MTNKPQQNAEEIEISPQLAPLGVVEIRAEYGVAFEQHARPVNLPDEPTAREVVTGVTIVPYWEKHGVLARWVVVQAADQAEAEQLAEAYGGMPVERSTYLAKW